MYFFNEMKNNLFEKKKNKNQNMPMYIQQNIL